MAVSHTRVRRLVLLRHASAEHGGGPDALRPLALAGRKQAARVGELLLDRDLTPELVLCSDAVRTRQTWDLLKVAFVDAEPEVVVSPLVYDGGVSELLALIHSVDERVRTVLVVGHEPVMSAFAAYLAGPDSEPAAVSQVRVGVPTASFSILDGAQPWAEWARRTVTLVGLGRPD